MDWPVLAAAAAAAVGVINVQA